MKKSKKKFNIILLGISGSGKGTQAKKIAKDYPVVHVSLGEALRREMRKKTPQAGKIKSYINEGKLVPNRIVCKVLFSELSKVVHKGFILEGFPRSADQPPLLDNFLKENNARLDLVISILVSPKVVLQRRKRAIVSGNKFQPGRSDDNPAALKKRFEFYLKSIKKISDYYRKNSALVEIDGERPIDDIYEDIKTEIEKI